MVFFFGAFAGTEGTRKRMPVTCESVAVMPSVANGVRTHAWKASTRCDPSGILLLPREGANLAQQVGRHGHALLLGLAAIIAPPGAGQANFRILRHRGDQRLDALVEDVVAGERA